MAAILSVPDIIRRFSTQLQVPSTKLQTSTKPQASNPKLVAKLSMFEVWSLRIGICL
jgi:hypothetical protein